MNKRPIGIFDSGLGGLTVMREVMALLPEEEILYYGDTARVPYGNKSAETVVRYALEISDFLVSRDIKLLVIACNTASAHALSTVQEQLNIPVVGVIKPGAAQAVAVTKNKRIAVLATRSTIQSGAYQSAILTFCPEAHVYPISCPLFVPLVEEHFQHHPAAKMIIHEYLAPLGVQDIDTVLLGCTHYPLMRTEIEKEIENAIIVDSASTCVRQIKKVLEEQNLLNDKRSSENQFFVSDDPEKFQKMGNQFLTRSPYRAQEITFI